MTARRTIHPRGRDEWIRYAVRVLLPVAVSTAGVYLGVDASTPSSSDVRELEQQTVAGGVADSVTAEAIRAMTVTIERLRDDVDLQRTVLDDLERSQRALEERVQRLGRKRGGAD